MRRALERERRLRRPVIAAKLWLQDAIAGRPQVPDERAVDAELDREVRAASAPTVQFMAPRLRGPIDRPPVQPAPAAGSPARSGPNRSVSEATAPTRPFSAPVSSPRIHRPGGPWQ